MEKSESETEIENLEKEILDETDNPYSTYSVQFPYTCIFTIPDDGNVTRVTIDSRSQVMRYGRNENDIKLQMELDQAHGNPTYAKHLIQWVSDRISSIDPREATITYGSSTTIESMSDEQIDDFREGCLNDE
jgi:hypothetical protein